MTKTTLNCYKISHKPDLISVAKFFRIPDAERKKDYLRLNPDQISIALKYQAANKYVWLYRFGCICFLNFEAAETYRFLKFLESTSGPIDYHQFSTYNETHIIESTDVDQGDPLFQLAGLYAIILAKSTELKSLEDTLNSIIDKSELFIIDLQKGFSNLSGYLIDITAKIIKLQMNIITNLHLLDRPVEYSLLLKHRDLYHQLNVYYELEQRFEIIQNKLADLNEITAPYQKMGHATKENRLLMLEIFLLILFPIFHIIHIIF